MPGMRDSQARRVPLEEYARNVLLGLFVGCQRMKVASGSKDRVRIRPLSAPGVDEMAPTRRVPSSIQPSPAMFSKRP